MGVCGEGAAGSTRNSLLGVFSGCGYVDPRLWLEPGGALQLARRLEQQLALASAASAAPVSAWLAHSLLPFQ